MKKNKFVKSTIILLVGGFVTKVLSMIIKIIMARMLKTNGMTLYSLVMPTFNLFITLTTLGNPNVVSKFISEKRLSNKKILNSSFMISLIVSLTLFFILLFSSDKIATFLHNENLTIPILSIGLSLPFISISSSIRGYFFGKQNMWPHVISNFIEQIVRIVLLIVFLPKINSIIYKVTFIIASSVICEAVSILILYLYLPRRVYLRELSLKIDKETTKEILGIMLPTTLSRLIGTIGGFIEPILLTNLLIYKGVDKNFFQYEYGLINGYVMPFLLLPSFFSMAISQSIVPVISNNYVNKNYSYIKKKIRQINILSLSIGIIYTLIVLKNPKFFLNLVYNTTEGINYLKILAPFFILLYIQGPNTSVLQSMNKAKEATRHTIIGISLKFIIMTLLVLLNFEMNALIISIIVNIIYVTFSNYLIIRKEIK